TKDGQRKTVDLSSCSISRKYHADGQPIRLDGGTPKLQGGRMGNFGLSHYLPVHVQERRIGSKSEMNRPTARPFIAVHPRLFSIPARAARSTIFTIRTIQVIVGAPWSPCASEKAGALASLIEKAPGHPIVFRLREQPLQRDRAC